MSALLFPGQGSLIVGMGSEFYTNFDLFGDEAQYWVWSKDLNLGYYSKPPFLPWVIALITGLLGNDFWVIYVNPYYLLERC